MDCYSVILKPSIERDLKGFPKSMVERIWERIEDLKNDPFPRQSIKLAGSDQFYRIRVGDYRIVYAVNTVRKQITIHYIRHRRDIYRKL